MPKYVEALELADIGKPQKLVTYFCEIQKRSIEKILTLTFAQIASEL